MYTYLIQSANDSQDPYPVPCPLTIKTDQKQSQLSLTLRKLAHCTGNALLVPHSIQLRFLFINFFFFLQVEGGEVLLSCFICQTVSMCLFVVYLVHIFCIFVDFVHDCTVSNDPQV